MTPSLTATLVIPQFFLVLTALATLCFTARVIRPFELIHGNCKILLNLINFAQICVVLSHLGKLFDLAINGDFSQDHPWYIFTQLLHEFGYFLCSSTEFIVVIERAVACRLLRRYDQSPTNYPVFLSLSSVSCISAFMFSYLVHIRKRKLECTIFAESMDLLTLLFACLCHWYSRRRYQHMLFHSSNLGSRYQLREVAEITRALIPISIVSVAIKLGASSMVWARIIYEEELPYAMMMSLYQSLHTLNAMLWCVLILFRHRGLRQKSLDKLRSIAFCQWEWLFEEEGARNIPDIDHSTNHELTQAHFDLLSASWQNFPKTTSRHELAPSRHNSGTPNLSISA